MQTINITMDMWECSGKSFTDLAKPGMSIDYDIFEHFMCCLPPHRYVKNGFQNGEPYSFDPDSDGMLYMTFSEINGEYFYDGLKSGDGNI